jgi:hypothetical protein
VLHCRQPVLDFAQRNQNRLLINMNELVLARLRQIDTA